MAIQIRRGSNAEWEVNNSNIVVGEPAVATDSKRAFIGTASGAYMELANLEAIAPTYDPGNSYMIDDYVSYQGKLYVCTVPTSGAWNASCWQITSLGQALAENAYSNFEMQTVSGDIVSFPNGAGGIPVKDLKAEVVATQNLHGYDYPWVGGAGKNLLPYFSNATSGSAVMTVNSDGSLKFTGTTGSSSGIIGTFDLSLVPGTYTLSDGAPSDSPVYLQVYNVTTSTLYWNDTTKTFPYNGTDTIRARIWIRGNNTTLNNTLYPQIEEGNQATTYEPYSNICPISGWSEIDINVRGKNFLHDVVGHTNPTTVNGVTFTQNSDGSITMNGTTTASTLYYLSNRSATPNGQGVVLQKGTYTLSGIPTGYSSINLRLGCNRGAYSSTLGNDTGSGFTFTESDGGTQYGVWIGMNTGATLNNVTVYPMIRKSTDSSRYEPYNGATYTTDLDGTRYGGTLDVTTGVLTVDKVMVDLGTQTWYYNTSTQVFYCDIPTSVLGSNGGDLISDRYKRNQGNSLTDIQNGEMWNQLYGYTSKNVVIKNTTYTTTADFKSAMAGSALVYSLATPQVVQLTPTQVRTVLGQNNIWADSGEVEVTYRISNVQ